MLSGRRRFRQPNGDGRWFHRYSTICQSPSSKNPPSSQFQNLLQNSPKISSHFIVPQLGPDVKFTYAFHKAVEEYKEAKAVNPFA